MTKRGSLRDFIYQANQLPSICVINLFLDCLIYLLKLNLPFIKGKRKPRKCEMFVFKKEKKERTQATSVKQGNCMPKHIYQQQYITPQINITSSSKRSIKKEE